MATLIVNAGSMGQILGDQSDSTGMFLEEYDPDFADGVGRSVWTVDQAKAKRFVDLEHAMSEWRRVSTVRPLREDGKPNRPLTAWSVRFHTVEN